MFTRFISLFGLVAPLVSALVLETPVNVVSGVPFNLTWTTTAGDPPFSVELVNQLFNDEFALANNIQPSSGIVLVPLGIVPASTYVIQAVGISNISDILSQTAEFPIASNDTSTGSPVSVSATGTSTNGLTSTGISLPVTASTSVSGVSASSSSTGTGTSTGTETGTTASIVPSSAAISSRLALTNVCGYAVLLLSAVAGAAVVAL